MKRDISQIILHLLQIERDVLWIKREEEQVAPCLKQVLSHIPLIRFDELFIASEFSGRKAMS